MRIRRVIASATAGLLAVTGVASASSTASTTESRNCAWTVKIDPDGVNALYPDQFARYWVLRVPATPGSSLIIRGQFPHARYTSFTTYDDTLRSVDGIPDRFIKPGQRSTNPFRPGGRRDTAGSRRHYTVHVVFGQVPSIRHTNTIYTTSADGSRRATSFAVALRIYEPDRGLADNGGVPLPSVTVSTPGGDTTLPGCSVPDTPAGANGSVSSQSAPYTGSGDKTRIDWHKFYNLPGAFTANLAPAANSAARTLPKGGFADNPDNKYISAVVETLRAPAIIIRGRLPLTPSTYRHEPRMSRAQLRYWSMCSNEVASERFYGCVMDDQLPLARHRNYTIVATTAADRPANAVARCGIAWLPAGPAADTVLIERNMLAGAGFSHSVQAARYDHERHDLGAYYPTAHYATIKTVKALGCHAPATAPTH